MGEDTFKVCRPAPKYSKDMTEKENQSSTRSCWFPGDSVLKLPPPTISGTSVLWEQEGQGKQNLCFFATPKSHLTFYNPFSSLGRGKKRERRWERQERKPKD